MKLLIYLASFLIGANALAQVAPPQRTLMALASVYTSASFIEELKCETKAPLLIPKNSVIPPKAIAPAVADITVSGFTNAAIQAAVNAAPASGARIILPAGRYIFTDQVSLVNKSNLTFVGDGNAEFYVPSSARVGHMLSALGPVSNIRVTGILFNNQSSGEGQGMIFSNEQAPLDTYEIDHCAFTGPNMNCNAIKFNAQSYGTGSNVSVPVKNVYIHHNTFYSLGRMGIEMQNHGWERGETIAWQLDNYRIEDNEFSDLGRVDGSNGMAISFTGPNQNIYIRRNKVVDAKYAAYEFVGSRYVEMSNNTATAVNNTYTGISISDNSHHVTTQLKFTNNNIVVKGNAFQSYGGDGGSVTNWEATNNTFISTTPSSGDMGSIKLQRTSGGRFINNTVRTGGSNVIFLDNAPQNYFAGNAFSNEDSPNNDVLIRFYNSGTYSNELANSNSYKKQQGAVTSNFAREEGGAHDNIFGGATTPPTTPTTPPPTSSVTGTILLLNGNGTDGSQTIVDASPQGRAVTRTGNPRISTAQKKYGPSSIFFDGSSSLTIPTSADFDFGTGDFTMEFFLYPTGNNGGYPGLLTRGDNQDVMWTICQFPGNNYRPELFLRANGSYLPSNSNYNTNLPLNTWTHVAVVSQNGTRKFYQNGVLVGTASANNGTSLEVNNVNKNIVVGFLPAIGSGGDYYKGFMHLRVTRGQALYSANFTPPETFDSSVTTPTTPPTTPTTPPPTSSVTGAVLTISGNGTNGSQNFVDTSPQAKTVTRNGNVSTSTAQSKYGGSSIYFDGSDGSYLSVPSSADFNFGTGDFTMEFFLYPTGITRGFPGLLTRGDGQGVMWTVCQFPGNSYRPELFIFNGGYQAANSNYNTNLSLNTWTHVALVCKNGVRKFYQNGILVGSASNNNLSLEANNAGKPLLIGWLPSVSGDAGDFYKGYMHLRVLKGTALYDGNFNPPTSF